MLTRRSGHASVVYEDCLYVIGGQDEDETLLSSVERFDGYEWSLMDNEMADK